MNLNAFNKKIITKTLTTFYVRDLQGNVLSIYEKELQGNWDKNGLENTGADAKYNYSVVTWTQKEVPIYGSERLGNYRAETVFHNLVKTDDIALVDEVNLQPDYNYGLQETFTAPMANPDYISYRTIGKKDYEVKDHLGNVRALVGDELKLDEKGLTIAYDAVNSTTTIDGKKAATLRNYFTYHPFGQQPTAAEKGERPAVSISHNFVQGLDVNLASSTGNWYCPSDPDNQNNSCYIGGVGMEVSSGSGGISKKMWLDAGRTYQIGITQNMGNHATPTVTQLESGLDIYIGPGTLNTHTFTTREEGMYVINLQDPGNLNITGCTITAAADVVDKTITLPNTLVFNYNFDNANVKEWQPVGDVGKGSNPQGEMIVGSNGQADVNNNCGVKRKVYLRAGKSYRLDYDISDPNSVWTNSNYNQFLKVSVTGEDGTVVKQTEHRQPGTFNSSFYFQPQETGYYNVEFALTNFSNNPFGGDFLTITNATLFDEGGLYSMNPYGQLYRYGFNGKERERNIDESANAYDFGDRIYDARIGRWASMDPLANSYPFASPYNFALNTPIQAFDPDGQKVIFVNGYYNPNWPRLAGGDVKEKYWGGRSFVTAAKRYFKENKNSTPTFYDGRGKWNSTGGERYDEGYEFAKKKFGEITQGIFNSDGVQTEAINIVSHSMGAAYAEGMIKYLEEQGVRVDKVVHLSPADPSTFTASPNPNTIQLNVDDDAVLGYKNFGEYPIIDGVDTYGMAINTTNFFPWEHIFNGHADTKNLAITWDWVSDLEKVKSFYFDDMNLRWISTLYSNNHGTHFRSYKKFGFGNLPRLYKGAGGGNGKGGFKAPKRYKVKPSPRQHKR